MNIKRLNIFEQWRNESLSYQDMKISISEIYNILFVISFLTVISIILMGVVQEICIAFGQTVPNFMSSWIVPLWVPGILSVFLFFLSGLLVKKA